MQTRAVGTTLSQALRGRRSSPWPGPGGTDCRSNAIYISHSLSIAPVMKCCTWCTAGKSYCKHLAEAEDVIPSRFSVSIRILLISGFAVYRHIKCRQQWSRRWASGSSQQIFLQQFGTSGGTVYSTVVGCAFTFIRPPNGRDHHTHIATAARLQLHVSSSHTQRRPTLVSQYMHSPCDFTAADQGQVEDYGRLCTGNSTSL